MHYRTKRWICLLLSLCLLISGVYFESRKVYDLAYAAVAKAEERSRLVPSTLVKTDGCTAEMLGIRENAGVEHLPERAAEQRRGVESAFQLLCQDSYSPFGVRSDTGLKFRRLVLGKQSRLLTNYMHRTDGKKRI